MSEELAEAIVTATAEAKSEVEVDAAPVEETALEVQEAAPATEEESTDEPKLDAERGSDGRFVSKPDDSATEAKEDVEDEPFSLSPELLKEINDDPKLQSAYKGMQSGFTKRMQGLSQHGKDDQEALDAAYWIRANPEEALTQLATRLGKTISGAQVEEKPSDSLTDDLTKKWEKEIGPEAAKILKPIIDQTIQEATVRLVKDQVAPLRERTDALTQAADVRGIESATKSFGLKIKETGREWTEEISNAMADAMNSIQPATDASFEDFMTVLYNDVQYRAGRTASKRTELKRLQTARETAEPSTTVRTAKAGAPLITNEMTDNEAIKRAVEFAERQLEASA